CVGGARDSRGACDRPGASAPDRCRTGPVGADRGHPGRRGRASGGLVPGVARCCSDLAGPASGTATNSSHGRCFSALTHGGGPLSGAWGFLFCPSSGAPTTHEKWRISPMLLHLCIWTSNPENTPSGASEATFH